MKKVATTRTWNTQVIGMADEKGHINTHRPFLVFVYNAHVVSAAIHGFINDDNSWNVPLNWIPSC